MNLPMVHLFDKARARRTDPDTSHAAADTTTTTVADSRDEVLYLLGAFGPLADHELVDRHEREAYLHPEYRRRYSPQRLRTARNELVEDGKVRVFGYTKTPSGNKATIWTLTDDTGHTNGSTA